MSVSLISASFNLLNLFWAIALLFLVLSCLICFGMLLRRVVRNRKAKIRERQKETFQTYIVALMRDAPMDHRVEDMPACYIEDVTDIFLHYFQTLKGKKKETLLDIISDSGLENKIIESTKDGTRGVRMRAVRVLSYLDTQQSLQVIFDRLGSQDKYVRLTAMRSLVKRKTVFFLNPIIESCLEAFPEDYKLLASILSNFGDDIIEPLETHIASSENDVLVTACLETLTLLMPMYTSVDFAQLMKSESSDVRAAAVSLSAITKYEGTLNPLVLGLSDSSTQVKIRAAKITTKLKRTDLTTALFKLTSDPVMWVRYWAFRAIWVSGASGQKLVTSMTQTNPMAERVALEMQSGYV